MDIQTNVPLAGHTTFKVGGLADFFAIARSREELTELLEYAHRQRLPVFILGGGSNVVVSDNGLRGLTIKMELTGIELVREEDDAVELRVAAGERWDDLVSFAVAHGFWGIENLSHIPGSTGAVAVQNVGAYGQEASQVVGTVEAVPMDNPSSTVLFSRKDCRFSYRSSIFNSTSKNQFVITSITFRLSRTPIPNLRYGDVQKYFLDAGIPTPTIAQIREAIISIRDKKFPFPREAINGSAGSFFKAHTILEQDYARLIQKVAESFGAYASEKLIAIKDRLVVPQGVKVPYGYLIELCGLKGKQFGSVAVCNTHAGVLLNATGNATAVEVLETFRAVRMQVFEKTGVTLQNEPELVGFSAQELEYYFRLE